MEEIQNLLSNPWELGGAITGFLCVWLAARENVLNWPVSMISVALYAKVFYDARLYSDSMLQIIFAAFQVYGWYQWSKVRKAGEIAEGAKFRVYRLGKSERVIVALAIAALWPVWYKALTIVKPDASLALGDALTTVMSVVAIFLQAKKIWESWILWIIADLIYIPLYIARDLQITALLYGVFLVLAAYGLEEWRKSIQPQTENLQT